MTTCKWLLEKDTFREGLDDLAAAVASRGMEYKVTAYVPFEAGSYGGLFPPDSCVVVHGSLQLCRQVRREAAWTPGVHGDPAKYECAYYYPRLGRFLLNSPDAMLPYGELPRQKDFLFETFGNAGRLFVRPNGGLKSFTGTVVASETYERDVERLGFYDVEPEALVVVAEPRNIEAEWRLVAAGGVIVASSLYRLAGRHEEREGAPDEVLRFGGEVAAAWQPEPACTLDICRLADGSLRLVEIGTFGGSGLYRCDRDAVVAAVSAQALADWAAARDGPVAGASPVEQD